MKRYTFQFTLDVAGERVVELRQVLAESEEWAKQFCLQDVKSHYDSSDEPYGTSATLLESKLIRAVEES
jgi:hypothetical protein